MNRRRRRLSPPLSMALLLAFATSAAAPLLVGGCSPWPEPPEADEGPPCAGPFADPRYDAEPLAPVGNGVCGAFSPVRLNGFRQQTPVTFTPPVVGACPLARALERWLDAVVQPAAREILGAPVTRILVASSYDCRLVHFWPWPKLSSHARAEAVDIAGFATGRDAVVSPTEHWRGNGPAALFLRRVFQGACGFFGTALGPDYDGAHRSHFHLDVQQRAKPFCR